MGSRMWSIVTLFAAFLRLSRFSHSSYEVLPIFLRLFICPYPTQQRCHICDFQAAFTHMTTKCKCIAHNVQRVTSTDCSSIVQRDVSLCPGRLSPPAHCAADLCWTRSRSVEAEHESLRIGSAENNCYITFARNNGKNNLHKRQERFLYYYNFTRCLVPAVLWLAWDSRFCHSQTQHEQDPR